MVFQPIRIMKHAKFWMPNGQSKFIHRCVKQESARARVRAWHGSSSWIDNLQVVEPRRKRIWNRNESLYRGFATNVSKSDEGIPQVVGVPEKKMSLKQLFMKYGKVAVVFHSCIFATTLSCFYISVRYGVDMTSLLNCLPFVDTSKLDPESDTFNLGLAYILTAATGPPRGVLTVAATPWIARRFGIKQTSNKEA